ncbi:hypothetical protein FB565_006156 [Actinoplanes lutulentus]|uniref:Uncharacterized protein n=1 Tax=Actinoplanes lutulentus TaxID=1287878 RepID=A0A327Z232_9ACTN|nr:hypothetical protein [Actinoplanes lutulentus]MBB2946388.1 hypothetical protein [Actinoplanes lutulentus]RAK28674.1 hypothetical protein B0I29_11911 [Actinoplanes lutulentus]
MREHRLVLLCPVERTEVEHDVTGKIRILWPERGTFTEMVANADVERGLATRFDKLGVNYRATLDLVELLDWLRAVPDGHDPRDRT